MTLSKMTEIKSQYPFYLANEPQAPNYDLKVLDKYSGEEAASVALASESDIDAAIAAGSAACEAMAALRGYERREILEHCVRRFEERFDELAFMLCVEAGKPLVHARGEVDRLIDTFRIAAGEAERIYGEILPLDISPRAAGYRGQWKRVPIGLCSFISPFNFPLNLTAHKVAPALACGCPFILKPASLTPLGALVMAEVLAETDLPKGAFSVLPSKRTGARLFTEDDRIKVLSFTGSPGVGWDLKARAGQKKVVLELGGNAACVVDEGTDLADAVPRVIFGAFYQSGQSCIGVQRVIVHEKVYDEFKERFVEEAQKLIKGDPKDEATFIGPMISEKEAQRLHGWVEAAVASGARLLCGGNREGAMLDATVLEAAPGDSDVVRKEAFGPVAILSRFSDFDAALAEVNDSDFGLQAGIFTRDIHKAHRAWDVLDVGGVVIGDVPSFRVDNMPYGGVKQSGLGREGVRFAIEDMTEIRLLLVRDLD